MQKGGGGKGGGAPEEVTRREACVQVPYPYIIRPKEKCIFYFIYISTLASATTCP